MGQVGIHAGRLLICIAAVTSTLLWTLHMHDPSKKLVSISIFTSKCISTLSLYHSMVNSFMSPIWWNPYLSILVQLMMLSLNIELTCISLSKTLHYFLPWMYLRTAKKSIKVTVIAASAILPFICTSHVHWSTSKCTDDGVLRGTRISYIFIWTPETLTATQ